MPFGVLLGADTDARRRGPRCCQLDDTHYNIAVHDVNDSALLVQLSVSGSE